MNERSERGLNGRSKRNIETVVLDEIFWREDLNYWEKDIVNGWINLLKESERSRRMKKNGEGRLDLPMSQVELLTGLALEKGAEAEMIDNLDDIKVAYNFVSTLFSEIYQNKAQRISEEDFRQLVLTDVRRELDGEKSEAHFLLLLLSQVKEGWGKYKEFINASDNPFNLAPQTQVLAEDFQDRKKPNIRDLKAYEFWLRQQEKLVKNEEWSGAEIGVVVTFLAFCQKGFEGTEEEKKGLGNLKIREKFLNVRGKLENFLRGEKLDEAGDLIPELAEMTIDVLANAGVVDDIFYGNEIWVRENIQDIAEK